MRALSTSPVRGLMLLLMLCLFRPPDARASRRLPVTSTSEYLADVFEFEDGLPSQVNSMAQTPDGYLWLGTQKGLFTFDGVTFTPIADPHLANPTAPAAPIPHLPSHRLFARILLVDRSGRLWVQWADGLACFQDGRMRPFGPEDGCPNQWNISQGLSGKDGAIYMNCQGTSIDGVEYKPTVRVFDGVRFSVLSDLSADFPSKINSRSLRQTGLNHIYVDPHNQLWGIYRNNLESFFGRFDTQTKQWVREPYPGNITGQGLGALTDAQGNLLVLEQRVIRRFDGRDWSVQRQFGAPLKPHRYANGFDRLFQDHLGQIWFAGLGHFPVGEGLYRIATNGSIFQLSYPEDLDSRSPSFVFEDQEHNLWTGTDEGVHEQIKQALLGRAMPLRKIPPPSPW